MTTVGLKDFALVCSTASNWICRKMSVLRYVIETAGEDPNKGEAISCYNWVCDHFAEKKGNYSTLLVDEHILKGVSVLGVTAW